MPPQPMMPNLTFILPVTCKSTSHGRVWGGEALHREAAGRFHELDQVHGLKACLGRAREIEDGSRERRALRAGNEADAGGAGRASVDQPRALPERDAGAVVVTVEENRRQAGAR